MINDRVDSAAKAPSELTYLQKNELKRYSNIINFSLISQLIIAIIALICAFILLILFNIVNLHSQGISAIAAVEKFLNNLANDTGYNAVSVLIYFSYIFIPFAIVAVCFKQNPFKSIPFKFNNSKILLPLIIIALAASVIGEFYSSYFEVILSQFHLKMNEDLFSMPNNAPSLILSSVMTCIFAPFCEEFLFRGLIMQKLRKFGDFYALLVSSILFGILHANFSQTPFAFIVGMALGFAVIETGSLFSGIIIHFIINSVSTAVNISTLFIGDEKAILIYYIYAAVIIVAAIVSLIYLIKRKHLFKGAGKRYFKSEIITHNAFSTFIKTPGFIIFACLFGLQMFLYLKVA